MSTVQEYISVIGCFQGMLLFGLLVADTRMTTASRLLGVICFTIALIFLMPFLLTNRETPAIAWMIGIVFFLPVASAPLGYLYCRSALLGTPLVRRDWLHALPVLFCYALTADISLANPQEMANWIMGGEPSNLRLHISKYLPVTIASGYGFFAAWIIWAYRKQANSNLTNFDPTAFIWLLSLHVFSLLVWFLKTLSSFTTFAAILINDVANLFLVILIYTIAIMQWRRPQLFSIPGLSKEETEIAIFKKAGDTRAHDGELDPAIRADLFKTVETKMESDLLYLDSALTLTSLSEATGLSKHHLSEVLNRHSRKNFYEFVNGYRVDFVRKRLAEAPDRTVLDIALEAGFSSKSTFNAIFKQFTGQTPSQYRKGLISVEKD